jgi:hypothetical protein
MASYEKDQFDRIPADLQRVGAHRGPKRTGVGWIGFGWAVLATGVLVVGGLYTLSHFFGIPVSIPFLQAATPTPTPTPIPTARPLTDPTKLDPARKISIVILNGTPVAGAETTVAAALTKAGWPINSTAVASQNNVKETLIYYSDPKNEDVARGLVVALGLGKIRLVSPDTFPGAPLTIVLGAEYAGLTPAASPKP